jgi:hypothetical protein
VTQPKPPWWQAATTPKRGFILGGVWLAFAAGEWWRLAADRGTASPPTLTIILAVAGTLLATIYLVSAVRLRRKLRADDRNAG